MNIIQQHLDHGGGHNLPETIVVHSMGEQINDRGKIYSAVDWLEFLKLSAHALITPSGDVIRCRHDEEGAWHARGYNKNSLGVEFLVEGVHDYGTFLEKIKTDYVTTAQYASGVELIKNWMNHHDIESVKRHSDVSPGRKVDPGSGFRWTEFLHNFDD